VIADLINLGVPGAVAVCLGVFVLAVRKGILTFVKDKSDVLNTSSSIEIVSMLRDQVKYQKDEIKDLQKAKDDAVTEVSTLKRKLTDYETQLTQISNDLQNERKSHDVTRSQLLNVIKRLDEMENRMSMNFPTISVLEHAEDLSG
jgi:chromosome segregation ATPase